MASITDHVVEGLKYPFNDIKKLLGLGALFAAISAISVFMSVKSFEIFRTTIHLAENSNVTLSHLPLSQLPAGDIYFVAGLGIVSFIISLFILGYQYDIVKFSIEKKDDLPGFSDIVGIFVKGIKYFLVVVAYNVIPSLVLMGGLTMAGDSSIFIAISLIAAVLFIIAEFLVIMALNNMIVHDSIKKAFDFNEIFANISNLGWGKYIGIILFTLIVYMIIQVAVNFVLSFVSVLFAATISNQAIAVSIFIALIEGLFLDSFGTIFFSRVCGSVYRESIK